MQTITDLLDPARAQALHASLDRGGDAPGTGDALPAFWHHIYFWDPQPPGMLGPDGHPATGSGLIPDLGLPQRMWAGGALEFRAPLIVGQQAEKVSVVESAVEKTGRSGRLGFVKLRHDIVQGGALKIREYQDLVYREPPKDRATVAPPMARKNEDFAQRVTFTTTQLFRYSALTFNGHRIHYDADYARDVEGYDGLVVHGPLLAQMLIDLGQSQLGQMQKFSFRATSALTHLESADLCWASDGAMWVRAQDGRQCMQAQAR